eukprot:TRINITY_DN15506_c0_g1_i2.p1 TRINITY_DN15506_c0_g1~~TRINITY_DN15506_c0_g1_i2.p1  ORF type:complete len:176 (+),score=44.80 TRINITY_DN15506_c0_g1_i2:60-530(+)
MPFEREKKALFSRRNFRVLLCVLGFVTLFLFLVGFGVGMDHEGKWSMLMLPDVMACILSGLALTLLSYTIVATDIEPIIFTGIQYFTLLSIFSTAIAIGKTGVITAGCEHHIWSGKEYTRHHCAATILEFYVGVAHVLCMLGVSYENIQYLPDDDW